MADSKVAKATGLEDGEVLKAVFGADATGFQPTDVLGAYTDSQASYLTGSIQKYGRFIQKTFDFKDPFEAFNRGPMEAGTALEVMVGGIAKAWRPRLTSADLVEGPQSNPFFTILPPMTSKTYAARFYQKARATIFDTIDSRYFNNTAGLLDYTGMRLSQVRNGLLIARYDYTIQALLRGIYDKKLIVIDGKTGEQPVTGADTKPTASELQMTIFRRRNSISGANPENNSAGYDQADSLASVRELVNPDWYGVLAAELGQNAFAGDILSNFNIRSSDIFNRWNNRLDLWVFTADHTITQADVDTGMVSIKELGMTYHKNDTAPAPLDGVTGLPDTKLALSHHALIQMVATEDFIQRFGTPINNVAPNGDDITWTPDSSNITTVLRLNEDIDAYNITSTLSTLTGIVDLFNHNMIVDMSEPTMKALYQ